MKVAICIPTRNEESNVYSLLQAISDLNIINEVLIIDDDSSDQTRSEIERANLNLQSSIKIRLLHRKGKTGRGSAIWDGFDLILASDNHEILIEMDADHSHDPAELALGIKKIQNGDDVCIAARYPDGEIVNWPFRRRILSLMANGLAKTLINPAVSDYTNGYRFYSRSAVEKVLKRGISAKGFITLSESLAISFSHDLKISTFATKFIDRSRGESNATVLEIIKSLGAIVHIGLKYRLGLYRP